MKKLLILVFVLIFFIPVFSNSNHWGNLELIYYYDSNALREKVIENIDVIELSDLSIIERDKIIGKLLDFADSKRNIDNVLSKKIYSKVLNETSGYWYLQNKIIDIEDSSWDVISYFKNFFSQTLRMTNDFDSSFLLINTTINSLFYSLLFVIFVYSIIMLLKYFILFANDFLIDPGGSFSIKKTLILFILLLWPILFFSGWAIYPFLIFGILFKYMTNSEKNSLSILITISIIVLFVFSINNVLTDHYKSDSFKVDRQLTLGTYKSSNYSDLNNEQKILYAFIEYENKNYEKSRRILTSTDEDYQTITRSLLLGNLFYKKFNNSDIREEDLSESMNCYTKVLRENENNSIALNNLALVLFMTDKDEDGKKSINSYLGRFPKLSEYKNLALKLKEPRLEKYYLWKRLLSLSGNSINVIKLATSVFEDLVIFPFIYYIFLYFLYRKIMQKTIGQLGDSTTCSKCTKIIKKKVIHKSYSLCADCHQLFLIKDVIFLEAKLLKEEEIKKSNFRGFINIIIISILIPGLNFIYREKSNTFVLLSFLLYFLLFFGYTGYTNFNTLGLSIPYIFNISGIIASFLYLLLNIVSIKGEDYGV